MSLAKKCLSKSQSSFFPISFFSSFFSASQILILLLRNLHLLLLLRSRCGCWISAELLTARLFSVRSSRRLYQNWMKMTLATSSVERDLLSTVRTFTSCTMSMNPRQTALTSLWWPSCPWTGTLYRLVGSSKSSAELQSWRFFCVSHAAQASDVGGHL